MSLRIVSLLFLTVSLLGAGTSEAQGLPSLEVPVARNAVFNTNKDARVSIEFTTIFNDVRREEEYYSITHDIASKIAAKFPTAEAVRPVSDHKWTFNDGIAKGEWDIEVDGNVNGKPVIEVTTPFLENERANAFDLAMDVFNTLPARPWKEVGGGHIRVKIHKKDITPTQLASFLRYYYSVEDMLTFSFRSEKRAHRTAAQTFDEAGYLDGFISYMKRMVSDSRSYEDFRQAGTSEFNLELVGGYMKNKGLMSNDVKSYNKYFALNMGRLYETYYEKDKNHLLFEFRFFDAPRTKTETRLHLKLVKALFQKAMNEQAPFDRVHHGKARYWMNNRDAYKRDLLEFIGQLGLDFSEYSYLMDEDRHRR